jgi:hypothetical protein
VAAVLEDLARHAHQFAQDLLRLDIRIGNEGKGHFNTANEAAADILANILIKPTKRSVLGAQRNCAVMCAAAIPTGLCPMSVRSGPILL